MKYLIFALSLMCLITMAHAQEAKRGVYSCSAATYENSDIDPGSENLTHRFLHAICAVIAGNDSNGVPQLYILADHHSRVDASFFLAEYLTTDGRFDHIATSNLTETRIADAINYHFRAQAIMSLIPSYPDPGPDTFATPDYSIFERPHQMELKSRYRAPRLYLHKYQLGFTGHYHARLLQSSSYGGDRNLKTYGEYAGSWGSDNLTLDSLEHLKRHASQCENLPEKRHFNPVWYNSVTNACGLLHRLSDHLYQLEQKRSYIAVQKNCEDLSEANCPEYFEVHRAIDEAIAAYVKQEQRIFAPVIGLNRSFNAAGQAAQDRRNIQSCLATLGYSPGPADGIFGERTRSAIRAWQKSQGYGATGIFESGQAIELLESCEAPESASQNESSQSIASTVDLNALAENMRATGKYDDEHIRGVKNEDINAYSSDGYTSLLRATVLGHTGIVNDLIAAGADVSARSRDGLETTPLQMAAWGGENPSIIEVLIAAGADVDAANNDSLTPLIGAAWNGYIRNIEVLIAAGADIEKRNNFGHTPLHIATVNGHTRIVEVLIAAGADVNVRDGKRYTPLRLADYLGHSRIGEILRARGARK